MSSNPNRDIYNTHYSDTNVRVDNIQNPFDKWMIDYRFSLIKKYGFKKDVLDLCCGSGSYLIPSLSTLKTAIGLDFSKSMLDGFKVNLKNKSPDNLTLLEADATQIPLKNGTVDFVYSYTALYHVPNVEMALSESGRVLRSRGYAVFELGNRDSLNTKICEVQHKEAGWAKPFHIPYQTMIQNIHDANLDIIDQRSFQLLNNYGAPNQLFYLYPLCAPIWKRLLGIQFRERMLDEWISSSRLLRTYAFRHFFVCKKRY